jgi:hypothetical protein
MRQSTLVRNVMQELRKRASARPGRRFSSDGARHTPQVPRATRAIKTEETTRGEWRPAP